MSEKIYQSTLEGMEDKILELRRCGNSTRLVDNAIQIIFSGKVCVVRDSHGMGSHNEANKFLFDKILKRLYAEHRLGGSESTKLLKADSFKREIYLEEE